MAMLNSIFADSEDEILAALRTGQPVEAYRGTGKTSAILRLAKELLDGGNKVVVFVPSDHSHGYAMQLWRHLFSDTEPPKFTSNAASLRGSDAKILVDQLTLSNYRGRFDAAIL